LEDHALLYSSERHVGEFAFLEGEQAAWNEGEEAKSSLQSSNSAEELAFLTEHFRSRGQDALYVNLSSSDLEPFGLHCARVILPHFQPIWFGRKERRLGGPRVREFPMQLGLGAEPVALNDLNPMPHPIA
jgi:ribosomal protein S12 methylthiotransferase accessory factor